MKELDCGHLRGQGKRCGAPAVSATVDEAAVGPRPRGCTYRESKRKRGRNRKGDD